jgi:hypothetical protein
MVAPKSEPDSCFKPDRVRIIRVVFTCNFHTSSYFMCEYSYARSTSENVQELTVEIMKAPANLPTSVFGSYG